MLRRNRNYKEKRMNENKSKIGHEKMGDIFCENEPKQMLLRK